MRQVGEMNSKSSSKCKFKGQIVRIYTIFKPPLFVQCALLFIESTTLGFKRVVLIPTILHLSHFIFNKNPKLITHSPIPVPTNTSNDKPYSSFFVSLSSAYSIHDPSKTAQLPSIIPLVPTYPAAVPANASQTALHTPTVHNRSYVSPLRPITHLKIIFSGSPMITPCFSKIARSSVGLRIM